MTLIFQHFKASRTGILEERSVLIQGKDLCLVTISVLGILHMVKQFQVVILAIRTDLQDILVGIITEQARCWLEIRALVLTKLKYITKKYYLFNFLVNLVLTNHKKTSFLIFAVLVVVQ